MNQLSITDYLSIELSQLKLRTADIERQIERFQIRYDSTEVLDLSIQIDKLSKKVNDLNDLNNRLNELDEDTAYLIGEIKKRSGLMSPSWFQRAITAWSYVISIQLFIGLVIFLVYRILF